MKYLLSGLAFLITTAIIAQPATEVWLFDLSTDGGLSNPINVSSNPGYDNQPSFTTGGSQLLYTSTRNGQTDIISYDIKSKKKSWLTSTPGSEYSPLQIPGTFTFSSILLEDDGRQLLWSYSLNGGAGNIQIPYLKIGYHVWRSETELYAFVLGPDPTFQKIDLENQRAEIIQEKIGRSLMIYEDKIYFIDQSKDQPMIAYYDPNTENIEPLSESLAESQDFAITTHGFIYMGRKTQLFRLRISQPDRWEMVMDLSTLGRSDISRIAIHPDNTKIAIVVAE